MTREWRPLLNSESASPPGPTKLGKARSGVGLREMVRPILVLTEPLRCEYGGEGERCLLNDGHVGRHQLDIRMER